MWLWNLHKIIKFLYKNWFSLDAKVSFCWFKSFFLWLIFVTQVSPCTLARLMHINITLINMCQKVCVCCSVHESEGVGVGDTYVCNYFPCPRYYTHMRVSVIPRVYLFWIYVSYTLYCLNNMTSTDLQITAYLLKRSSNNQDKDILFLVIFTPCWRACFLIGDLIGLLSYAYISSIDIKNVIEM